MIICITNRKLCSGDFLQSVEKACEQADMVILREKDLSQADYISLASEVSQICTKSNTLFYVHTFVDAARCVPCQGLHLSFYDFCQSDNLPSNTGVSIHSIEEAVNANNLGAAYLTAGHIFPTLCKEGVPAKGLCFLKRVVHSVQIPVYAIGGINDKNKSAVFRTGAQGVCMMSGFMK